MNGVQGGPVVVDPRMRSRRIEVQRDAGRRRLRRVLTAVGVAGVLLAAFAVTRSPVLDVDHVRATGGEHTDPAAVAVAAGVGRGEPMVSVDTGAVARRVEALPWVRRARVERRWPGTLRITITERTPAAIVPVGDGDDARLALVDATGRVLADGREGAHGSGATPLPPGLPVLAGVRGEVAAGDSLDQGARDALAIAAALTEALPGTVTEVSTELEATLGSGGRVRFDTAEDLDGKIVAVEAIVGDVDLDCLDVLDVRVPGSPVLTRNEGCP